ncbi:MAG: MFS transporter [Alphaproteobacteria bacterium]|nr:MFS transporter [Rickettsiales bacterium]
MKKYKNIALFIFFGGLSYSSFTSTIMILSLKDKIENPIYLTLAILSQKFIKIFSETPTSIIADLYGVRKLFFLVPFMMLITMPLLKINTVPSIILCIIIQGVSVSIKSGKIEGSIYNALKKDNNVKIFPKVLSIYFIITDLLVGLVAYFSGILYAKWSYNGAILATGINVLLSIIIIWLMEENSFYDNKPKKCMKLLKESFKIFKNKTTVIIASLILTFYNFFGWQFGNITKLLLSEYGVSTQAIAKYYGTTHILMSAGSLISFFISTKLSVVSSIVIWLISVSAILICSLMSSTVTLFQSNFPLLTVPLLIYPILYPIMQIPVIKYIENRIPSSKRMTISSFGNIMAIVINITFNISIAICAKFYGNYVLAIRPTLAILLLAGVMQMFIFIKKTPYYKR